MNEIDQLSTSSWEIMRYIRRDAEFAKLIKKLSVRAHVPAGTGTYERREFYSARYDAMALLTSELQIVSSRPSSRFPV